MLKAGFISLGCAKNLVDTEVMLGLLTQRDIAITDRPEEADILIVNTCSFINSAKEESISTILQMAEFKQTGKCRGLIVAGCLGQRYRQELLDELPEVDAIIGTEAWHRIVEAIDAVLAGQRVLLVGDRETIYDETTPRISTTPFYSQYVKIAEGCNHYCAFCIIPAIRGHYRSRSMESVEREVRHLAAQGVKEINLIAQDTTSYGIDLYGKPDLAGLLRRLCRIEGVEWLRLLYCYPKYFSDELIDLIASEPKICKYVDLPLQHIDDQILKAMRRPDSREDVEGLLTKIRRRIPGVSIRSTFIVGFPGETPEHFAALKTFLEEQKFDHAGIFTYSPEEDTPAASMPDQIPDEVKEERYHELMALQCRISEELNDSRIGQEFTVLVEGDSEEDHSVVFGRSAWEAPDVDGKVYVENAGGAKPGDMIRVRAIQGFSYDLLAERI